MPFCSEQKQRFGRFHYLSYPPFRKQILVLALKLGTAPTALFIFIVLTLIKEIKRKQFYSCKTEVGNCAEPVCVNAEPCGCDRFMGLFYWSYWESFRSGLEPDNTERCLSLCSECDPSVFTTVSSHKQLLMKEGGATALTWKLLETGQTWGSGHFT